MIKQEVKVLHRRKVLIGFVSALALATPAALSAQDYSVTLKAATAFSRNSDLERGFWTFVDKVEALSGGHIKVNYIGGPEAIPPFEQIEGVRSGIVDLTTNAGSYFSSVIPEGDALKLSELTPWEERENGATELISGILAEKGVHYVGRYNTPGLTFNFYTTKKVEKMSDLAGLRMRISPLYKSFAENLGIVPVQLAHSEIYAALERGLVDGIGASNIGMSQQGHQEFLKYIIEPSFYGNDQVIIMNQEVWAGLPDEAKRVIDQAIQETEHESSEGFRDIAVAERKTLLDAGLTEVTLPEADEYLAIAREKGWEDLLEHAPENGPELKRLLTK